MIEIAGFFNSGTGRHQSNTVYKPRGIIPALTTIDGGTQQIKVLRKHERHREDRIHEPLK